MAANQSIKFTRITRTRRSKGKKPEIIKIDVAASEPDQGQQKQTHKSTKVSSFDPEKHPRGPDGRFINA